MLYRQGNRWALCPFKVRYVQHGQQQEQYTHDKQWWLDFAAKWDHTTIIEFIDIEPTPEQLERYEQIKDLPEDFGAMYSEYAETGEFTDADMPSAHPFRTIILHRENAALRSRLEASEGAILALMDLSLIGGT